MPVSLPSRQRVATVPQPLQLALQQPAPCGSPGACAWRPRRGPPARPGWCTSRCRRSISRAAGWTKTPGPRAGLRGRGGRGVQARAWSEVPVEPSSRPCAPGGRASSSRARAGKWPRLEKRPARHAAHPPAPTWRRPARQSRWLHSRPAWWPPAHTSRAPSRTGCGPAARGRQRVQWWARAPGAAGFCCPRRQPACHGQRGWPCDTAWLPLPAQAAPWAAAAAAAPHMHAKPHPRTPTCTLRRSNVAEQSMQVKRLALHWLQCCATLGCRGRVGRERRHGCRLTGNAPSVGAGRAAGGGAVWQS